MDVDTGVFTEAEAAHPVRQTIDTHVVGNLVEEGIYRLFNGLVDIDLAVAPAQPVTERAAVWSSGSASSPDRFGWYGW